MEQAGSREQAVSTRVVTTNLALGFRSFSRGEAEFFWSRCVRVTDLDEHRRIRQRGFIY